MKTSNDPRERVDFHIDFQLALRHLKPKDLIVLTCFLNGLTQRQIAAIMECSQPAIHKRMQIITRQLRFWLT